MNKNRDHKGDPEFWTDERLAERFGVSRTRIFEQRHRAIQKLRDAVLRDPVLRQTAIDMGLHSR